MKAFVISGTTMDEVSSALDAAVKAEGKSPSLAMAFAGGSKSGAGIAPVFSSRGIDLYGTSTGAVIHDDMVLDEAISALCLYLEKGAYGIRMFEAQGRSSYALGREVALWAGKKFKTSIFFIVAAGSLCIGDELLNGITSHAGGGAQVYGCIAGAEPSFYPQGAQPFVFDENQTVSDGLCVLALDGEKISVEGISANGWRGIGTHKTITRSKGNILYSIDNIPALDIIERYLKIDGHPDLACEYGLLWEEEDGTQVMRSIVAVQEDKSIVYSGSIPTGARVRFGLPPGPEITDHLMSRINTIKTGNSASALVLFSCRARYLALGPLIQDEVAGVRENLPLPTAGGFAFGEFGPGLDGVSRFHNYSVVTALISEKVSKKTPDLEAQS